MNRFDPCGALAILVESEMLSSLSKLFTGTATRRYRLRPYVRDSAVGVGPIGGTSKEDFRRRKGENSLIATLLTTAT